MTPKGDDASEEKSRKVMTRRPEAANGEPTFPLKGELPPSYLASECVLPHVAFVNSVVGAQGADQ